MRLGLNPLSSCLASLAWKDRLNLTPTPPPAYQSVWLLFAVSEISRYIIHYSHLARETNYSDIPRNIFFNTVDVAFMFKVNESLPFAIFYLLCPLSIFFIYIDICLSYNKNQCASMYVYKIFYKKVKEKSNLQIYSDFIMRYFPYRRKQCIQ